ncbi:mucoidy inhibitor MuiA family protein [Crocinitomicaceae bacterium]|nr:mucoidy inhibitor MuiA family protein [Crocinitomicaceae bacterium]
MKNLTLLLSILISVHNLFAGDTLKVSSKIKDVTCFFQGAQVTRTASVRLPKGKQILVFNRLPFTLNDESVQLKSSDNCKVLSVKHELVYPSTRKSAEEKKIEDQIEVLEIEMKAVQNRFDVFGLEEKLLMDNSNIAKKYEGAEIANIKDAANYYRARLNEIRQGKLDLSIKMDLKREKIKDLYAALNTLTSIKRNNYSKVIVAVDCISEAKEELKLSYYMYRAGWTPNYDFRVDDVTKPLDIVYNANVFQSSGESWDKVNLTLSTSDPTLDGEKPELVNWILGNADPYKKEIKQKGSGALKGVIQDAESAEPLPFAKVLLKKNGSILGGANTDFDGKFTIKPIPSGTYDVEFKSVGFQKQLIEGVRISNDKITFLDESLNSEVQMLEEVTVVTYTTPLIDKDGGASISRNDIGRLPVRGAANISSSVRGVREDNFKKTDYISNSLKTTVANLEYEIDIPYTIPSDGQDYSIKMKELSVPVKYIYHAVPKLDEDAFLTAELTDWTKLNILPGKSNIYYEGTFVGSSNIDTENATDTLSISLGRDKNIAIKREGNKELFDKRVVGSLIKETIGWKISVRNNKDAKINIVIEDQFPISYRKSIDVDRIDYVGAKLDDKTGMLLWDLELNANESKDVQFNYQVRYPKYLNMNY